jgi:hypothetical protein
MGISAHVTQRFGDRSWEPVQLVAPDGFVRANFIRIGVVVTNFWAKDKRLVLSCLFD